MGGIGFEEESLVRKGEQGGLLTKVQSVKILERLGCEGMTKQNQEESRLLECTKG